jgi:hypothetical protein
MTFDSHRRFFGDGKPSPADGPYRLTVIQSVAWHARGEEGEVVRREIRAEATRRGGVAIYDADGRRLEPVGETARGGRGNVQHLGVAEALLDPGPDAVVVVLGLNDRDRDVRLVVEDVVRELLRPTVHELYPVHEGRSPKGAAA